MSSLSPVIQGLLVTLVPEYEISNDAIGYISNFAEKVLVSLANEAAGHVSGQEAISSGEVEAAIRKNFPANWASSIVAEGSSQIEAIQNEERDQALKQEISDFELIDDEKGNDGKQKEAKGNIFLSADFIKSFLSTIIPSQINNDGCIFLSACTESVLSSLIQHSCITLTLLPAGELVITLQALTETVRRNEGLRHLAQSLDLLVESTDKVGDGDIEPVEDNDNELVQSEKEVAAVAENEESPEVPKEDPKETTEVSKEIEERSEEIKEVPEEIEEGTNETEEAPKDTEDAPHAVEEVPEEIEEPSEVVEKVLSEDPIVHHEEAVEEPAEIEQEPAEFTQKQVPEEPTAPEETEEPEESKESKESKESEESKEPEEPKEPEELKEPADLEADELEEPAEPENFEEPEPLSEPAVVVEQATNKALGEEEDDHYPVRIEQSASSVARIRRPTFALYGRCCPYFEVTSFAIQLLSSILECFVNHLLCESKKVARRAHTHVQQVYARAALRQLTASQNVILNAIARAESGELFSDVLPLLSGYVHDALSEEEEHEQRIILVPLTREVGFEKYVAEIVMYVGTHLLLIASAHARSVNSWLITSDDVAYAAQQFVSPTSSVYKLVKQLKLDNVYGEGEKLQPAPQPRIKAAEMIYLTSIIKETPLQLDNQLLIVFLFLVSLSLHTLCCVR